MWREKQEGSQRRGRLGSRDARLAHTTCCLSLSGTGFPAPSCSPWNPQKSRFFILVLLKGLKFLLSGSAARHTDRQTDRHIHTPSPPGIRCEGDTRWEKAKITQGKSGRLLSTVRKFSGKSCSPDLHKSFPLLNGLGWFSVFVTALLFLGKNYIHVYCFQKFLGST